MGRWPRTDNLLYEPTAGLPATRATGIVNEKGPVGVPGLSVYRRCFRRLRAMLASVGLDVIPPLADAPHFNHQPFLARCLGVIFAWICITLSSCSSACAACSAGMISSSKS